jgi:Flp pilus assembly pilin Flp
MIKNTKNGFLSLEYVLLIVILVAALIAISGYLINALSGRWRESTDSFGSGRQYGDNATTLTIIQ